MQASAVTQTSHDQHGLYPQALQSRTTPESGEGARTHRRSLPPRRPRPGECASAACQQDL